MNFYYWLNRRIEWRAELSLENEFTSCRYTGGEKRHVKLGSDISGIIFGSNGGMNVS